MINAIWFNGRIIELDDLTIELLKSHAQATIENDEEAAKSIERTLRDMKVI